MPLERIVMLGILLVFHLLGFIIALALYKHYKLFSEIAFPWLLISISLGLMSLILIILLIYIITKEMLQFH